MSEDFSGDLDVDFNKFADEFLMEAVKPKVPRQALETLNPTSRTFGFPPSRFMFEPPQQDEIRRPPVATCPPTDHDIQFIVSGIVACAGETGTPPNGIYTLTFGGADWEFTDGDGNTFGFLCDAFLGEQFFISRLPHTDWFTASAAVGVNPVNNSRAIGDCTGDGGYDGSITWSSI